jgi:hypothetical protein
MTDDTQYRIERLRQRLALDDPGELGLRFEVRGAAVIVRGIVPDADCLETVMRLLAEELDGLTVHTDISAAHVEALPVPEEL